MKYTNLRKRLKYIIGFFIIAIGLTLKIAFNHNMDYWLTIKTNSIILFIIGLVLIIPFDYEITKENSKVKLANSSIKWILAKIKLIGLWVLLLAAVIGLERLGIQINYQLRDYFLSKKTESTIGYVKGIKRIDTVKIGYEDFYVIDAKINGKIQSKGLIIKYADKDNDYFDNFNNPKLDRNGLTIEKLKGNQVEILYSKIYPSFFRINK